PDLLETGGGIANICHLVPRGEGLIVYNGDILTDLPLTPALESHASTHSLATLVVRRDHPEKRISLDESSGSIVDIRGQLATGYPKDFGFTGIYCLSPEFLALLPPVSKYSVVSVFLDLIRSGRRVTGVSSDTGSWADLGDRSAYLDASAKKFPLPYIDPKATVDPSSTVTGTSYIDAGATVGAGATLVDSVLWPNATVAPGSALTRCIVRNGELASGIATDQDF
ncbi:MAG: hypothetical protein P8J87_10380, partial [Verrucomicrobiales bacterium]|nr:hypothetical protein [Verrucomicrobiales bacterium]